MKKLIKISLSLVACVTVLFSLTVSAFASNVSYDDKSEQFVFSTGSKENPSDLFENFKNAMPGDKLTQEIELKNLKSNRMSVKFFIKSTGATKESKDLLSKLTLTVAVKDKSPFFEAPADQTSTLTDWVELGTLHQGGKIDLVVTLSVPETLGNEYMGARGELDWHFKSIEQPIDTKKTEDERKCRICHEKMTRKLVKGADGKYYYYYECQHEHTTPPAPVMGDAFNVFVPVAVMLLAIVGMVFVLLYRKRNRENS